MRAAAAIVKNTESTYAGWAMILAGGFLGKVSILPHLENRTGLQEGAACLE